MQPPPPAGLTGMAPPGAGAGVALLEAAVVLIAVVVEASAVDHPTATTSAAKPAPTAPMVLACRFPTISYCSHSSGNVHGARDR
jgi:hypothetical protein